VELIESLSPLQRLALLGVAACGLLAAAWSILTRLRLTSVERERRRRGKLNLFGRMGDGVLNDLHDNTLFYTYSVHGVAYNTAQDISSLRAMIPADVDVLIGPVTVKYSPRNPANSIVLSEGWSGVRVKPRSALGESTALGYTHSNSQEI
jgi:hypothetical protein